MADEEPRVEVPSFFLCPISLQIMRDPVTLATGITYDRESIERWTNGGHLVCPVTKIQLADVDELTPNHTLRRLIQSWCIAHAADGVERFPTPRPPLDANAVDDLLSEAAVGPSQAAAAVRRLASLVGDSDRNKRLVAGHCRAVELLMSAVTRHVADQSGQQFDGLILDSPHSIPCGEEALAVLCSLKLDERALAALAEAGAVGTLTAALGQSSYRSRANAISLLKAITSAMAPVRLTVVNPELIAEAVKVVQDQVSPGATKAALQVLCRVIPWGRNRVRAVEAGAVEAAVDALLDETENRRIAELLLAVVDHASQCAEGRQAVAAHPAGLAVVAKRAMRVSVAASQSAVRVLHAVAKYSPTASVLKEMAEVGAVAKLCLVAHSGSDKMAERAVEVLRLHSRVWRTSPCLPPHFKVAYPR